MINGLGAGTVGEGGNPSLFSSMITGVIPSPVDSTSAPLSSGRGNYLPTQSQASYHSASASRSAWCPASGFDVDNQEAGVCANVDVADGQADIRASAVMTHDNDDNANDGNWMTLLAKSLTINLGSQPLLTLISLLVTLTPTLTLLALHFSLHSLHSPPSPLSSPLLLLLLLLGGPSKIQEFSLS